MNFDQMGSDLLQQPLLSSQIIPELTEDDLMIKKLEKPEMRAVKPQAVSRLDTHKVIQNPKTIQIKGSAVDQPTAPMQKVQFVKRTNLIQISDPKATIKSNTVINDNIVASTPIVINKVNGNISGKYLCYLNRSNLMKYVESMCVLCTIIRRAFDNILSIVFKAFAKWFKLKRVPIRSLSSFRFH